MKIGIDARWIFSELSGIGIYTRDLIRHLTQIDNKNEYVLFFDNRERMQQTLDAINPPSDSKIRTHLLSCGPFSLKSQIIFPRLLTNLRLDIFHSTNFMIPLAAFPREKTRCVITIHDLIPLLFPEHTPKALKTRFFPLFRRIIREAVKRADLIITVSESTRRDMVDYFQIPVERRTGLVAIHEGVENRYQPAEKKEQPEQIILYVGRMDPYKNLTLLIEAFAAVRKKGLNKIRLMIVGPPDPRYPEALRKAEKLGVSQWMDWSGYRTTEELVKTYQQADLFVLPSKYEGFGLTVLEAMACGTPVICSNVSSLPEVAGDAALLIDPTSKEQLANAMLRVLTNSNLAHELREKGLRRAAQFTWAKTAELTLKAYEQVLR